MLLVRFIFPALAAVLASGCGSGGDNTNATQPATGSISGYVVAQGDVALYSIDVGLFRVDESLNETLIASTTTYGSNGLYAFTGSYPTGTYLVKTTGVWCYYDNNNAYHLWTYGAYASIDRSYAATVCPSSTGGYLLSYFVFHEGSSQTVAVTPLTNVVAGRMSYRHSHDGTMLSLSIDNATNDFTVLLGFNPLTDIPKRVFDDSKAGRYFLYLDALDAIVAEASYKDTVSSPPFGTPPYTLYDLVEIMRRDVAGDGMLDGIDTTNGTPTSLSIGTRSLSSASYRHDVAVRVMQSTLYSKIYTPGINIAPILAWINSYNNNASTLFSGTTIALDEGGPRVRFITADGYTVNGGFNIRADVADLVGLDIPTATDIFVDGVYYSSASDDYSVSHIINTTIFPNGLHTIQVRSKNLLNSIGSASITATFNN